MVRIQMKHGGTSDHAGTRDQLCGVGDTVAVQVRFFLQSVRAHLEIGDDIATGIYVGKRECVGRRSPFHIIIAIVIDERRDAGAGKQEVIAGTRNQRRRPAAAEQQIGAAIASDQGSRAPPTTDSSESPPVTVSMTVLLFEMSICLW